MRLPLQITFRRMDSSPALEARIRERAEELERFCGDITSCRVVVEHQTARQRQGRLFDIRIDITVPGREIVVRRDPGLNHAHEDVYVAVRDAFDAARRQIENYIRERRREVKTHAVPDHGRVARLVAEQDYGFIVTPDGREIYFHRNSVAGGAFEQLETGDEVRFVAQHGESAQGPQASTVVPLGKHHLPPVESARR